MPEPLQPAPPRRLIRNAAWVVAWREAAQSHVYRRDVDLTVEGDTVAAIGPAKTADDADAVEIDGRGLAVLPGFVDIHAHPCSEPMLKGLTDEVGSRQLYMSSLYEYLPLFEADPEGRRAATEVALCELMQSGVTTVCDLSAAREDWLDTLGASGMRVYAAPMFRSGRWYTPNGREVRYTWDEQAGREWLDRALRVIDRAPASVGPSRRRALPGTGRHLHRSAIARQRRGGARTPAAFADPCGAKRRRVLRDHAAARPDADRMAARDRRARRRRVSTVSALPARDPGEEPLWAGYARRFISGYVPTLSAEDLTISRDRYTGIGVDEFPQREGDLKTLDMLACEDRRRGRTARSHQARGRGPQCGVSAFRQPLGDPASGPIRHGRQFFDIEGGRAGPVFGQRRAIAQHDGDRFADIAARGRELTILPQIRTSTSRHRRGARFAPDSSLEQAGFEL